MLRIVEVAGELEEKREATEGRSEGTRMNLHHLEQ